jgi:peroxiredoxin
MTFNRKFVKAKGLTLRLLSDPGNRVAEKFNLVYQLPEDLRKVYLSFGVDLAKFNGDDSWTLPMPARFVIDRAGIIRSADVNADYTVRPEPSDTIRVLRSLAETSDRQAA